MHHKCLWVRRKKLPFRCRQRAVRQRAVQWVEADQFELRLGAEDDRFRRIDWG